MAALLILPQRHACCAGYLPQLSMMSLNPSIASIHEKGFYPRDGGLAVKDKPAEDAGA